MLDSTFEGILMNTIYSENTDSFIIDGCTFNNSKFMYLLDFSQKDHNYIFFVGAIQIQNSIFTNIEAS